MRENQKECALKTKTLPKQVDNNLSHLGDNGVSEAALDQAFSRVDLEIEDGDGADLAADFHRMIGRQEVLSTFQAMTSALLAENLHRLSKSKYYKQIGLTFEEACQKLYPQLSIQTCYRRVKDYAEFGQAFFQLKDIVRISSGTYRLINPTVEDGSVVVGGETYQLTKANAPYIQAAIQEQVQRLREQGDKLSHTQGALTKVREERDNARTAAEKAREELQGYLRSKKEAFPELTPQHKLLIEAEGYMVRVAQLLEAVRKDPETTEFVRGVLRGLVHYGLQILITSSGEDPWMGMLLQDLDPRSPIGDYVEAKQAKKTTHGD